MSLHAVLPCTLRLADATTLATDAGVAAALRVPLARNMARAAAALAAEGQPTRGRVHAARVNWRGDPDRLPSPEARLEIADRITALILGLAAEQGLSGGRVAEDDGGPARVWRRLGAWRIRLKVADYLAFAQQVDASLAVGDLFLDVAHEHRSCQVWLVGIEAMVEAGPLFDALVSRMAAAMPNPPGQVDLWLASHFEHHRLALLALPGTRALDGALPSMADTARHHVGANEQLLFLPGARVLMTRMRLPEPARLHVPPGGEAAFWATLRAMLRGPDRRARADAAEQAVALRAMPDAVALIREALASGDAADLGPVRIRHAMLDALAAVRGRPWSVVLLLVDGTAHPLDTTADGVFRTWLSGADWPTALAAIERVLVEAEPERQRLAARLLLRLRAWLREPGGRRRAALARALEALLRRRDLFTGGALGLESQRLLILDRIAIVEALRLRLARGVSGSPFGDPHRDADLAALERFRTALVAAGDGTGDLAMEALEALRARLERLTVVVDDLIARVDGLHAGVREVRRALEDSVNQGDEVTVLFDLRRRLVGLLPDALSSAFFEGDLAEALQACEAFHETLAAYKFRLARSEFNAANAVLAYDRLLDEVPRLQTIREEAFWSMRSDLRDEHQALQRRFAPLTRLDAGGVGVVLRDDRGRAYDFSVPRDLQEAIACQSQVAAFRIRVAMFGDVATSVALHDQLLTHEIGDGEFRRAHGACLQAIRREVIEAWNQSATDPDAFQRYLDRHPSYVQAFQEIDRAIRREVREAIALEIFITLVVGLVSFGIGLGVRALMVGRTIAVIRTAAALETAIFAGEVALQTGSQLALRAAYDRDIGLGTVASTTLHNLVMIGGMRGLGRLGAPLMEHGWRGFIAFHGISASVITGAGALSERIRSGRWPADMEAFLTLSLASYVVMAGLSHGLQRLMLPRLEPGMRDRTAALARQLDASNRALFEEMQDTARRGILSPERFATLRSRMRANVATARDHLARLRSTGVRSTEDVDYADARLAEMDAMIASMEFVAPPGYRLLGPGGASVRALPAPDAIVGVRAGRDASTYHVDASRAGAATETMLARYEAAGYAIQRLPGGMVRVATPTGALAFVLDPSPLALGPGAVARPMAALPPGDPMPPLLGPGGEPRTMTLLERAAGQGYLTAEAAQALEARIAAVNREAMAVVEAAPEHTQLLMLRVLLQDYSQPSARWPIAGVRGLRAMLETGRGVPLRAVLRLVEARGPADAGRVMALYEGIADWPGAALLLGDEVAPSTSVALVEAYDALRRARISLPEDMGQDAVWGLQRWIRDGRDIPVELGRVPLGARRLRLEADSARRDPRVAPPSRLREVLRRHAEPLDGVDLYAGSAHDAAGRLVAAGEASGHGRLDPALRPTLDGMVQRYRDLVARLQSGGDVERNVEGARDELDAVLGVLQAGGQVFSLGTAYRVEIDPSLYPLSRGIRLVGHPDRVDIQLDVGAHAIDGRMLVAETTTGELSLPDALRGLDPDVSPAPASVDWSALDPGLASHRKWMQAIKLRAAARFAHALGEAWGGTPIPAPVLRMRVGRATAPARRALVELGFEVIETDP